MRRGLAAGLLVAPLLVLSATPASAASTVTSPDEVTQPGPFEVSGAVEWDGPAVGSGQLRVLLPGATSTTTLADASGNDPRLVQGTVDTAPCTPAPVCAGGNVAPNGEWTIELWEVGRSLGEQDRRVESKQVRVDVPALPPQDVTATLAGRTVTVTWARGVGPERELVEPDVTWTVDDGAGRRTAVGPEACSQDRCSVALPPYPDDVSGSRTVTVAAARPGASAPATTAAPEPVVVPAVPGVPSREPSAALRPGGSGQATAQSFGQGFSRFGPDLRLPKLPSATQPPTVQQPEVADTFSPTLGFEDRTEVRADPEIRAASPGRDAVLRSTGGALDESAVRGVAGALVMLMAGAHLRTWLSTTRPTDL